MLKLPIAATEQKITPHLLSLFTCLVRKKLVIMRNITAFLTVRGEGSHKGQDMAEYALIVTCEA